MANLEAELRGLLLTATELKNLSGWPDSLVEDYLNLVENLITVATAVDADSEDIGDITQQISVIDGRVGKLKAMIGNIGINAAQIAENTENIINLDNMINVFSGTINKNKAKINNIINMIENMLQLQATNMGSAQNRANLNKQQRRINDIEQLMHVG